MNVLEILLNIYSKMLSSLVGVPVGDFFYWKLLFLKTEMRLGIARKGNSLYSSRLFVTNRFHGV